MWLRAWPREGVVTLPAFDSAFGGAPRSQCGERRGTGTRGTTVLLCYDGFRRKLFFLGPVGHGHAMAGAVGRYAASHPTRAARLEVQTYIALLHAAAHRSGHQTWPRGRAAAHARFPHARPLMETTTCVSLQPRGMKMIFRTSQDCVCA